MDSLARIHWVGGEMTGTDGTGVAPVVVEVWRWSDHGWAFELKEPGSDAPYWRSHEAGYAPWGTQDLALAAVRVVERSRARVYGCRVVELGTTVIMGPQRLARRRLKEQLIAGLRVKEIRDRYRRTNGDVIQKEKAEESAA